MTANYQILSGQVPLFLFEILGIDPSFLDKAVAEWELDPGYLNGKEKVYNLMVINDLAERGVKLSAYYLDTAKLEVNYQNNLQAVECNRKNHPNLRCKKSVISVPFHLLIDN